MNVVPKQRNPALKCRRCLHIDSGHLGITDPTETLVIDVVHQRLIVICQNGHIAAPPDAYGSGRYRLLLERRGRPLYRLGNG